LSTLSANHPPRNYLDSAAILLLSMGEENAAGIIRCLSRSEVESLSERMAHIANVSQDDVSNILGDFFDCYRKESGVSGASRKYLERALDKAVGRKLSQGMLDEIYGGALAEDIRRLEWVPTEMLVRFLEQEHIQMQALVLAFLPPEQASAVLSQFSVDKHDDILYRIASLGEISEFLLEDLKLTMEACIEYVGSQAGAQVNGVEKVAEIMNRYSGDKSSIMSLLKIHNEDVAGAIEDRMFSFDTLLLQTPEVIAQLFDDIPDDLWLIALKGWDEQQLQKLFSALPKRLAGVYQQQLQGIRGQTVSKVNATRNEIMLMIRKMFEEGEVDYRLFEEETVE